MRIISGAARGRRLKELTGLDIRPTSDMIKESIFNIVQFDIEGRRVLDLFAGTGQLGIEALSRGARNAVFVDSNPDATKLIKQNLKLCDFFDFATVQTRDALKYLDGGSHMFAQYGENRVRDGRGGRAALGNRQAREAFDLIFMDPPYDTPLAAEALSRIIRIDKLNTNGIIICELKADAQTPTVDPPYFLHKEYKYGSTKILRYDRWESKVV